jgi:hypothetical protein
MTAILLRWWGAILFFMTTTLLQRHHARRIPQASSNHQATKVNGYFIAAADVLPSFPIVHAKAYLFRQPIRSLSGWVLPFTTVLPLTRLPVAWCSRGTELRSRLKDFTGSCILFRITLWSTGGVSRLSRRHPISQTSRPDLLALWLSLRHWLD